MVEVWDLYTKERIKTNKVLKRGDKIPHGYYHLVVEIWTITNDGHILLTQRHPNKTFPLLWECTGGSALQNENSRTAATRELYEEIGLYAEDISHIYEYLTKDTIFDVWVNYVKELNFETIKLQDSEVIDAKLVTLMEFQKMHHEKKVIEKLSYLYDLIEHNKIIIGDFA